MKKYIRNFLKGDIFFSDVFLLFSGVSPAEISFRLFVLCGISKDKHPIVLMVLKQIPVH